MPCPTPRPSNGRGSTPWRPSIWRPWWAATLLRPLVGGAEPKGFAALLPRWGGPADGTGAPPADPAVESTLRKVIVRIVVTYDLATVGSVFRTLEIWHDIDGPGLNRRRI